MLVLHGQYTLASKEGSPVTLSLAFPTPVTSSLTAQHNNNPEPSPTVYPEPPETGAVYLAEETVESPCPTQLVVIDSPQQNLGKHESLELETMCLVSH